jgi:hypothetical protein
MTSSQRGIAMKTHRLDLVRDSLELLRQVRAGLANDSVHSLMVSIDAAIVRLELLLHEGSEDPKKILDVLQVLARGLAAIPAIQHLIESFRDQ